MLRKLEIPGIKFPKLFIAANATDETMALEHGLPYIKWKGTDESLVKVLIRPLLERKWPHVNWDKVLGRKRRFESNPIIVPGDNGHDDDGGDATRHIDVDDTAGISSDMADGERTISGSIEVDGCKLLSIEDYAADIDSYVDIKTLQSLGCLPKFIGDVADCVRVNLVNRQRWTDGWNRKLNAGIGRFDAGGELPNLIIIDVSNSIPRGISATMLSLADTMRGMCNAELIVTGAKSYWWPVGAELPSPNALRRLVPPSNEACMFNAILKERVANKRYGHIICFGDDDCPNDFGQHVDIPVHVEQVHYYHTWRDDRPTGYAKWVKCCSPNVIETFDDSWCNVMYRR